jgi:hypothetical protein
LRRLVLLGLALLGAVASGCGGTSSRDRVDAYVKTVNAAQAASAPAFREANRSYARFIRRKLSGAEAIRRMRAAEAAIRRTEARVARVPAPAPARTLRAKLLRVYELNAELAHETALLAAYSPAQARAMRPVARASNRLQGDLKRSTQPGQQAAAFGAYGRRLAAAITALKRLKPPPVAAAAHRQELRRLDASRRLADSLRAAVLARDPVRTARLVAAFRRTGNLKAGERKAQLRQLKAYTARRRAIGRAVGEMQRERARLDRS